MLAQLARQTQSIHSRHILVSEHQIKRLSLRFFKGIDTIHGLYNLESGTQQREGHHLSHGRRIIDSEY
jgi:hypothetical protein